MPNMRKLLGVMAEAGYTQEALADKTGIGRSSMSCKINGKRPFDVDEAAKICEVLNISDPELKCQIFLR